MVVPYMKQVSLELVESVEAGMLAAWSVGDGDTSSDSDK